MLWFFFFFPNDGKHAFLLMVNMLLVVLFSLKVQLLLQRKEKKINYIQINLDCYDFHIIKN